MMNRLRKHNISGPLCALLCLMGVSPAQAKDGEWQVSMGAGVNYAPRYEGAAYNRLRALPLLDINYSKGGFFIGIARGIGYNFSDSKYIQYGIRVQVGKDRSQSEDPRLYGMGDINYYPDAGLFLSSRLGPLSLSTGVATSDYGTHADVGCGLNFPLGKSNSFRLGARANWGDTNYNQTYFGVTPAQALASGNVLTPYNATEGKKDTTLTAGWTHNFTKEWFSSTTLTYKRLEGSAQLSPLTQRTSMNGLSIMLGYRF